MDKNEVYWQLSGMEEHFNNISTGIRGLASAWLLAAFAAFGWFLDPGKQNAWVVPLGLLLLTTFTLGIAGTATLWVMDEFVYHRLLNSVFMVGLKMEASDPALPPIRAVMMKTFEGKGAHRWSRLFYLGPMLVLVVLSAVIVTGGSEAIFSTPQGAFLYHTCWIGYLLVSGQVILVLAILLKQRSVSWTERAKWLRFGANGEKQSCTSVGRNRPT